MQQTDPDDSPAHSRGFISGRQGFHQPVVGQRSLQEARRRSLGWRGTQTASFLRRKFSQRWNNLKKKTPNWIELNVIWICSRSSGRRWPKRRWRHRSCLASSASSMSATFLKSSPAWPPPIPPLSYHPTSTKFSRYFPSSLRFEYVQHHFVELEK